MLRFSLILFAACGMLCQCATNVKESPESIGQRCRIVLPGKWKITSPRGSNVVLYKTFYPNGTAESSMVATRVLGSTSVAMQPIKVTSRWRIEGNVVTTYQARAEWKAVFAEQDQFQDKILSVSQDRIVTKSLTDGSIEIAERIQ